MLWCCIFSSLCFQSPLATDHFVRRKMVLGRLRGGCLETPPVMDVLLFSLQSGGSEQERTKKKRRGDRYSVQTSLIVAALKKLLPIGLNMCSPADQELINLAKIRYSLVQ